MKKIAYIIPGFGQDTKRKEYQQVMAFFRTRSICPICIHITWKHRVMSDYVQQFKKQLHHTKNQEVYLFGFSFGAMIAFIASAEIKPKVQLLCSLSPYFKEDLPHLKKSWKKYFGKKRMADLKTFSFDALARKTKCKTILVAGTKEGKKLLRRVKDANRKVKNSELFLIEKTKHDLTKQSYLETVKQIISRL